MDGHKPFLREQEALDASDYEREHGSSADLLATVRALEARVKTLGDSMAEELGTSMVEVLRDNAHLLQRAQLAEAAAANWEERAHEQGVRAERAEEELSLFHDLRLPAAAVVIVSVARRHKDRADEAEERAQLAERRLAALECGEYYETRTDMRDSVLYYLYRRNRYETLTALADAIIAAQQPAQQEGGAQ